MCRKDKKDYLIGKCQKIEDLQKDNRTREMYDEIKDLTKTFQPRLGVIKDENGNTFTEFEKIADRWKRYCEEMYSDNQSTDTAQHCEQEGAQEEEPMLPPLRSEIEWAINSLKDGKSPGCDNIQAEMIKASGEEGIDVYHKLCTNIWEAGKWPSDWMRPIFYTTAKEGRSAVVFQL